MVRARSGRASAILDASPLSLCSRLAFFHNPAFSTSKSITVRLTTRFCPSTMPFLPSSLTKLVYTSLSVGTSATCSTSMR